MSNHELQKRAYSPQRTVAIRRRQKPMAEAEAAMARPSSAVACYGGWIGDLLQGASIVPWKHAGIIVFYRQIDNKN